MMINTRIREVILPPKNISHDMSSLLAAMNRRRVARIIRAAAYIFATIATATTMVLTEGRLISWPVALPIIAVAVVSWATFLWMNRLDERYLQGVEDHQRKEIASGELRKLLNEKLSVFADDKSLILSFENINKILGYSVIADDFIEKLINIKNCSLGETKSLLELAEEQGISLAISGKGESVEQGWFGRKTVVKNVELHWSGKREEEIRVELSCPCPD